MEEIPVVKVKRFMLVLISLTLLLAIACNSRVTIQPLTADAQSSSRWEYTILGDVRNGFNETIGTSVEALNSAGRKGWEAVTSYGNGATLLKRRL